MESHASCIIAQVEGLPFGGKNTRAADDCVVPETNYQRSGDLIWISG